MIFSYKELKRLASLDGSIKLADVTNAINSLGFEVENEIPFGNVAGIKFGKVLTLEKNPNADTLNVAKLEFDDKERTIQTNANNLSVGDVVIAFVPGSSKGDVTFAEKELQGIVSEGMLTSISEFGVEEDLVRDSHEGIMTYNEITDLSVDPIKYLGLRDILIDVDVLSNRSDAQSYSVMAKELAAYFNTSPLGVEVKKANIDSSIKVDNNKQDSLVMFEADADFEILAPEQILLAKSNIKSVNNIVDLTNLTLIMTGQPTHAYDKESVGESFKAETSSDNVVVFGEKEVQLENNLVITSDNKVVSVAGVIGLESTGVSKDTKKFVLEVGNFDSKEIRNSMKKVKLSTAASVQSSKNFGNGTTKLALDYLASKLNHFSEPVGFETLKTKSIDFTFNSTSLLAGFDITKHDKWNSVLKSLEALGFVFNKEQVELPSYRYDINSSQDINEEIFRFFGYNTFEPVAPKWNANEIKVITDHKTTIAARGFNEVTTYTLISKAKNVINPFGFEKAISLDTFVSKEREEIRLSQAISLLDVIEYNSKRGIHDISIFSEGMIGEGVFTHAIASTTKTFEQMKSDIVNILPEGIEFVRSDNKELHPGVSATINLNGKQIGWVGKVHPIHTKVDAFIAEFILDNNSYIDKMSEYSSEPLKKRDITFELKDKEELSSYIKDIDAVKIDVIDTFIKDDIKKITVRLTLTDAQIEKLK